MNKGRRNLAVAVVAATTTTTTTMLAPMLMALPLFQISARISISMSRTSQVTLATMFRGSIGLGSQTPSAVST